MNLDEDLFTMLPIASHPKVYKAYKECFEKLKPDMAVIDRFSLWFFKPADDCDIPSII